MKDCSCVLVYVANSVGLEMGLFVCWPMKDKLNTWNSLFLKFHLLTLVQKWYALIFSSFRFWGWLSSSTVVSQSLDWLTC